MRATIFSIMIFLACSWAMAQSNITRDTYVYSVKGADTLHLDVYVDRAKQQQSPQPVMLYVHGGGFSMGSRKNAAQEIYNRFWAEQGFVSVAMDYRLAMTEDNKYNVTGLDQIVRIANEDAVSATASLLEKAAELNIDPNMIMISGGSAGAVVCLTLENDICNDVDYTKVLPEGFNYAGIISHAGALSMQNDTLIWAKKPCPILFFHGDKDIAVPFEKSEIMGSTWVGPKYLQRQFKAMEVPHWIYFEKGADHVMAMKPLTNNNLEQEKFYNSFIKDKCKSMVFTEWIDETPADMTSVESMLQYVPMYILGFGKYLEEIDFGQLEVPKEIVY